jgi:hypothetical protein
MRVESSLAEALEAEIRDEPGGLPLLSTALVELWMARKDGWLTLEAHESRGGVRGAVARLADSSYENLTDDERAAARRLFMRLVSTGDEGSPIVCSRRMTVQSRSRTRPCSGSGRGSRTGFPRTPRAGSFASTSLRLRSAGRELSGTVRSFIGAPACPPPSTGLRAAKRS